MSSMQTPSPSTLLSIPGGLSLVDIFHLMSLGLTFVPKGQSVMQAFSLSGQG